MFQQFTWNGKVIPNIRKWASDRHEPMIKYRALRSIPNILGTELSLEIREGEMPQSFWDCLLMDDSWHYEKIGAEYTIILEHR
jgi:hypothetical protein